jgi:hypothetical protein
MALLSEGVEMNWIFLLGFIAGWTTGFLVKKWLNHRKINRVFPQAKGEHLDNIGEIWGVKRDKVKRLFWHFRESDKKYRIRMLEHMRSLPKEFGRKNDQNANDRK